MTENLTLTQQPPQKLSSTTTTTKISSLSHLRPGDHIYVIRSLYQHHGIYVGPSDKHPKGAVIHFAPLDPDIEEKSSENCVIQETCIDRFILDSDSVYRKEYGVSIVTYLWKTKGTTQYTRLKDSTEAIIQRARSRIGQRDYNLRTWNCEHFSHWCVTGDSKCSDQVRGVIAASGGAVVAGLSLAAAAAGVVGFAAYKYFASSPPAKTDEKEDKKT